MKEKRRKERDGGEEGWRRVREIEDVRLECKGEAEREDVKR